MSLPPRTSSTQHVEVYRGPLRGSDRGLVKICGLRRAEDAQAATVAGADLLGFIFAPARRQVTVAGAGQCLEAARVAANARHIPHAVGVFVNATADEMNGAADIAGLDLLQLHGDEAPELLARLRRPVIKALRPPLNASAAAVLAQIDRYAAATNAPVAYLVDGFSPTAHGGAGVRADWALVRELAARQTIVLAGGLDPENVRDAIDACSPFAVDVSSGVERDGVKEPARIGDFVRAAKAAFRERSGKRGAVL